MILDPALNVEEDDYWPYITGLNNDVFSWPTGRVAYPDFFKESTKKWWIDSIQRHHDNISFDGIWIDMNEPGLFIFLII